MKRSHGTVFRVPRQDPGAIATCAFCDFSRFFRNDKRKRGSAVSRAKRSLDGHLKKKHPEKGLRLWLETEKGFEQA